MQMFKGSLIKIHPSVKVIGDSGYQGAQKIHSNFELPKKNYKSKSLTSSNKNLSIKRVPIEHVFCRIKRFKIISTVYRNNICDFASKVFLLAGIYNFGIENRGVIS